MKQPRITLEGSWHQKALTRLFPPEGTHEVVAERITMIADDLYEARFVVFDGESEGFEVHETFDLQCNPAKFYELVAACGIKGNARSTSLKKLTGVRVTAYLEHVRADDQTYRVKVAHFVVSPASARHEEQPIQQKENSHD